ncbi:MAG: ATP-binding protein [Lachnospiraceae bacterium]|nr:ATP-binding protein [Lachnospiraceae bacterium]
MVELTVPAVFDSYDRVTAFVEAELEKRDCPITAQSQISIALDEIYSNIVNYAYPDGTDGELTLQLAFEPENAEDLVCMTFIDNGVPYNPLIKSDPDTTLSAEEREVGGLGIFMVKQLMDHMEYEFRGGQNILILKKKFKV